MSSPAGKPSSNALAVKSVSGNASAKAAWLIYLKLSVVEISTSMRAGRSLRAHTMPESTETSPDWTPWVTRARSAARLRYGLAIVPAAVIAADAAAVPRKRRRVSDARCRMMTAIGPPPSNHGGPCPLCLTTSRHRYDGSMTRAGKTHAADAPACTRLNADDEEEAGRPDGSRQFQKGLTFRNCAEAAAALSSMP